MPDAKGKLPACVTQSLLWWEQSLDKLGLDSSAYIEGRDARKGRNVRKELAHFLQVSDLDDLLKAYVLLGVPTEDDGRAILKVVERWNPAQSVANLLFHPTVIPEPRRYEALLRGFRDDKEPYFLLACTVGCQAFAPGSIPEPARQEILGLLFTCLRSVQPVVADRASISIAALLTESDTATVLGELLVASQTVAHNLSVCLLKFVKGKEPFDAAVAIEAVRALAQEAGLTDDQRAAAVSKVEQVAYMPLTVTAKAPMFLFSYLPNYSDYETG